MVADTLRDWMRGDKQWSLRDVLIECPHCGYRHKPKLSPSKTGVHIRADCRKCKRFIKFLSQKPPKRIPE